MSSYEDYCVALQLVADGPGTAKRELDEIAAEKQNQLDSALRRDREVQARWSGCDRATRDLGVRIRKLTDFTGGAPVKVSQSAQPLHLGRVESELTAIEKNVQELESAMDWVNRARRQVSVELGKLR